MKLNARGFLLFILVLAGISSSAGLAGCGSSQPAQQESAPTRYALRGEVISIDKAKQKVVVDGEDIPGFMSAMQMSYDVKNPNLLEPLSPRDQITADVVVSANDVWLENIAVVKKTDQAKSPASSHAHPDSSTSAK